MGAVSYQSTFKLFGYGALLLGYAIPAKVASSSCVKIMTPLIHNGVACVRNFLSCCDKYLTIIIYS